MSTSSLHCLKLDPVLRKSVADILVPTSKIKVCPIHFYPRLSSELVMHAGDALRDTNRTRSCNHTGTAEEAFHTSIWYAKRRTESTGLHSTFY